MGQLLDLDDVAHGNSLAEAELKELRATTPQVTTAALAALTDCSPKTVRKWALQQQIKRIGRDYLFTPEQVAAFLSRDRKPGRKPKPDAALSRSGRSRRKSRKEKANEN